VGVSRHVVLVGCGHAHALVLERWARDAPAASRLTLVTDRPRTLYSGMLPGLVAGQYREEELSVDAGELARRAGADLVLGRVTGIDPDARSLTLGDGRRVGYDVLSLDVGSTLAGLHELDPAPYVVPVRPADDLAARARHLDDVDSAVVVGGGAAGVEIAAAIRARRPDARVTLLEAGASLLSGYHPRVRRRVSRALSRRGVDVRLDTPVRGVGPSGVTLADGEMLHADLTVWATGSAAHPFLARSGLPVDAKGYLRVESTLRVPGEHDVFAAGDCASFTGHELPKAGVHAVRQGPILARNLVAVLQGEPLEPYRPQKDFLILLNLGDGTAIGTRWGHVVEGRWVHALKDRIDRRFVGRFRHPSCSA
jgi:pyridine nucleotide-disulfide oxidoreductase family protein